MAKTEVDQDQGLPPGATNGEAPDRGPVTEMTAEAALDRLRKGQALENVRIERLCFEGEFPLPFKLKNCQLIRPQFDGATFQGEVAFMGCTLEKPVFGRPNVFANNLLLNGSTLVAAMITKITVKGSFNAEFVHCKGKFDLLNSQFEGTVRFWEANFEGWVDFRNCTFNGEADLRSLHAHHGFGIYKCTFKSPALFRGASIAMKCDMSGTRFEALLDLSRAKLHDYVYLETIEQGPNQQFAFHNTLGERILVTPEQLTGRLASEVARNFNNAMHEYAFLKRSYSSLHRFENEDWAFYRFKVNQRRCAKRSWWRPWTKLFELLDWLFLDLGCGYCTSPRRAIFSALLLMLGFSAIYMVGIEQLNVDPGRPRPFPNQELTGLGNRAVIGIFTSVAVFTSGVSGIHDMANGWMNVPLIVESLLGTLLWGLFIISFSRKVIR
jgi:hypothetical protein